MFKVLALWFLTTYSLDIVTKSYDSLAKENTFMEMKEYMYSCQKREDKLREQCDLKMYRIPSDQGLIENLIDSCYIHKNYYLANKMEATDYEHFLELSYNKVNVGSVIVFEGTEFTLIREGIKQPRSYSYSNQMNEVYPRDPLWQIKINDYTLTINTLTINNIK
tara:strand:- start:11 stop:502 length:492 start_codon:yes stop_codon:yes gene_type:complete